ncbi:MAG TPA: acyl-CoA dehydrogenase family protein [Mycobacteriales bacterium]
MGLRATVSHLVRFDRTFLPEANLIDAPGAYPRQNWQTAFVPHHAASFLGAAEAAYDHAVDHVLGQGKTADPYVQQRVGAMAVNVETSLRWLRHVATLWDAGRRAEAQQAGARARHLVEHLALRTADDCVRACGARVLVRPSPVARILGGLTFYARHDNDDRILATIGRSVLGHSHDISFYGPWGPTPKAGPARGPAGVEAGPKVVCSTWLGTTRRKSHRPGTASASTSSGICGSQRNASAGSRNASRSGRSACGLALASTTRSNARMAVVAVSVTAGSSVSAACQAPRS